MDTGSTTRASMNRRAFLGAFAVGSGAILVAGCSGGAPASPAAPATVAPSAPASAPASAPTVPPAQGAPVPAGATKVSMVSFLTGPDGTVMQDIVNGYNKSQDKVFVEYSITGWGSQYITKVQTGAVSGAPPDIAGSHNFELPSLIRYDYDLTDTEKTLGLHAENYVKLAWDIPVIGGKRYGYCMNMGTMALFYNKDLFKKAGLDPEKPPTTADEFLGAAKKITNADQGIWGYAMENYGWFPFPTPMFENGGDFMDPNQTTITFNNDAGIQAMQLLQDWTHKEKIAPATFPVNPSTTPAQDLYYAGKAGMMMTGPWELSKNLQYNTEKGTNFAWTKLPTFAAKGKGIYSTTHIYQILRPKPEDGGRKEAALTWLKYLATEGQSQWARAQAVVYLPAQEEVKKSTDPKTQSMLLWINQNDQAKLPPTLAQWSQINAILIEAFGASVFATAKPVKDSLDEAAKKATDLLKNQ